MITAIALPATSGTTHIQPPLPFVTAPRLSLPSVLDRGDAGELRHKCARFMQAIAEVLGGERAARQLGGWLSAEVLEELQDHAGTRQAARMRIASVHVSMPSTHTAEIAARAVCGQRSHAIAARLDKKTDVRGRESWRCTALVWA